MERLLRRSVREWHPERESDVSDALVMLDDIVKDGEHVPTGLASAWASPKFMEDLAGRVLEVANMAEDPLAAAWILARFAWAIKALAHIQRDDLEDGDEYVQRATEWAHSEVDMIGGTVMPLRPRDTDSEVPF